MIHVWRSLRYLVISVLGLGVVYPLIMTAIGQTVFPFQANGSLVRVDGRVVGSRLIAQTVTVPWLFDPRPSAVAYNAMDSGATNYGPTNPALLRSVRRNLQMVERQNPGVSAAQVPTSMVESSGSGLDPDITIADAMLQVPRVARASGIPPGRLRQWIRQDTVGPWLGLYGDAVVNVWQLNLQVLQTMAQRHRGR
jgi:K+-transporting ATPase ATPase C chain